MPQALPDIYRYPPGFPGDSTLSKPAENGGRDVYAVLVGVQRFICNLGPGEGFIPSTNEVIRLRRARSDLGAHYARIFQRAGRPVEVAKEEPTKQARIIRAGKRLSSDGSTMTSDAHFYCEAHGYHLGDRVEIMVSSPDVPDGPMAGINGAVLRLDDDHFALRDDNFRVTDLMAEECTVRKVTP